MQIANGTIEECNVAITGRSFAALNQAQKTGQSRQAIVYRREVFNDFLAVIRRDLALVCPLFRDREENFPRLLLDVFAFVIRGRCVIKQPGELGNGADKQGQNTLIRCNDSIDNIIQEILDFPGIFSDESGSDGSAASLESME